MKRAKEILKLPILTIFGGEESGIADELLIDADKGSVEFLVVKDADWFVNAKILPFSKIKGIGFDLITTYAKSDFVKFVDTEIAQEYARKAIKIIGTKVYDETGEFKGVIDEIIIDENNGKIHACELLLNGTNEIAILPASSIITYGKEFVIIDNDAERTFVNDIADLKVSQATKTER